jgi:hypothetical protein
VVPRQATGKVLPFHPALTNPESSGGVEGHARAALIGDSDVVRASWRGLYRVEPPASLNIRSRYQALPAGLWVPTIQKANQGSSLRASLVKTKLSGSFELLPSFFPLALTLNPWQNGKVTVKPLPLMAKLSAAAPLWAQRRAAFAAESRGQDPTPYIQTAPGGTPGRIQGVSALQRIGSMQAYRARTSLRPQPAPQEQSIAMHGELRRGEDGSLWRYDATTGRGVRLGLNGEEPTETTLLSGEDLAMQQFRNRRKQLIQGGISAPDASLGAAQEYIASPNFTGPQNYKPRTAFTGPVNRQPGADQGLLAQIRERAKQSRPRVQY